MAATGSSEDTLTEHCEACDADTPHAVSLEIVREGEDDDAGYSNEPYRVAECTVCGNTDSQRMNGGGHGKGETYDRWSS